MIKPVNGHILIEPVVHDSFIASANETYEEIGIVVDLDDALVPISHFYEGTAVYNQSAISVGDKVYFDSWLAAKYPRSDKEGDFFWLVKWEDVRAVEHGSQENPSK